MDRIAIIADDLTGALDTASPFACAGLNVWAALQVDALDGALTANPDVIAVSTNSRELNAAAAARLARDAAQRISAWLPNLILKKIDSRLKGNIAVETAAVTEVFGFSRIVAAPAVPEQGRLVRGAKVEGMGIGQALDIGQIMPGSGFVISVPDTASDADLDRVATGWRRGEDILFACARGLAQAFARRFTRSAKPMRFAARPPVLVAAGSRDPITARQIAALHAANPDATVVMAPGGMVPQVSSSGALTVYACSGEVAANPQAVAARFAKSLATEIRRSRPATMLLTGGETAAAVLEALGVKLVQVRGEAAPGLAWFEIPAADGETIACISKSGGFGNEDTLVKALAMNKLQEYHGAAMSPLSSTA
jgi:uncharacterized protein YgbK (DUF1537 family)